MCSGRSGSESPWPAIVLGGRGGESGKSSDGVAEPARNGVHRSPLSDRPISEGDLPPKMCQPTEMTFLL